MPTKEEGIYKRIRTLRERMAHGRWGSGTVKSFRFIYFFRSEFSFTPVGEFFTGFRLRNNDFEKTTK